MDQQHEEIRDLRIETFIGEHGRRYRVTHIPSGECESESVAEAVDAVNTGLEGE